METKEITIKRVLCEREGWGVISAVDSTGKESTYTGKIIDPVEGLKLIVTGEEITHPKFGRQFKVTECKEAPHQTGAGLLNYLLKADIKGLGPKLARKIVETFGEDTVKIIRDEPDKLTTIRGISKIKAAAIHEGEKKRAPMLDLLKFEGITFNKASLLFDKYKEKAVDIVAHHPYQMIYDIDGIGFKIADNIALKNGLDAKGPERIAAAITFALVSAGDEGHCFDTRKTLLKRLEDIIPDVPDTAVDEVLKTEISSGRVHSEYDLVSNEPVYYACKVYLKETSLAGNIATMIAKNPTTRHIYDGKVDSLIAEMEAKASEKYHCDFKFEEGQKTAVHIACDNAISLITGGAGTGKTTIIKAIAEAFKREYGDDEHVFLCAPTGKAAKRMEEATGHEASTIHRLILAQDTFVPYDSILICDESSMLDIDLAEKLSAFLVKHQLRAVFVGDSHQLPPIGAGMFFRDLLNSKYLPKTVLSLCHRQEGNIALNADKVNRGEAGKMIFDGTTTVKEPADKEAAPALILKHFKRMVDKYGVENVCVISPMRKAGRSPTSSGTLNPLIRNMVNPNKPMDGSRFAQGDRIMNLRNDKEEDIYNGDVGIVLSCSKEDNTFSFMMNDKVHTCSMSKQEDFDLAYAMTVHKSQGSEYQGVIFAINMDSVFMVERALVYTALTRAKTEMVVVGEGKALGMAIHKTEAINRRSNLLLRLGEAVETPAQFAKTLSDARDAMERAGISETDTTSGTGTSISGNAKVTVSPERASVLKLFD